jgi:hypothetical protein
VNDLHDDLRELLRRKAEEVPTQRLMPRSLARRARGRIAVNALAVGVTVAVFAGGLFAGVRTFGAAHDVNDVDSAGQPPSSAPSTPPAVSKPACTGGQLRATGSMEGAAGSREGGVTLTNFSDTTCTLQGRPTVELLHPNLNPILSGITFLPSPPGWKVDALPKPAGWPVVTIHPGKAAFVRIRWSNWCPDGRAAPLWRLDIPGGGTVDVANGFDELGPPPCNGPGLPSTVEVGPFEPLASSGSTG